MAVNLAFNRPFKEQVDFFRQKINLPTERWDDIFKSAHDRAFIIAGVTKADLLESFRSEVDRAIEQGKSLQWFRGEFDRIVDQHGWTGWTGEGTKAGRDWRTRIIYQTNMSTNYAAGRWTQLNDPDLLKVRPYRTYVHADGIRHPRPHHVSWNGITLPHDDVFWQTHFTPNGWLCHCRIVAASARDFSAATIQGKGVKPDGWNKTDPKTGELVGIDKGFGYAPGANATKPLRGFVQEKLIKYPPAIATALKKDINKWLETNDSASEYAKKVLSGKLVKEPLWLGFVENHEGIKRAINLDLSNYLVLLDTSAVLHVRNNHQFDGKGQRPAIPKDYDFAIESLKSFDKAELGEVVRNNSRIRLFKEVNGETLIFIFELRSELKHKILSLVSLVIKTK